MTAETVHRSTVLRKGQKLYSKVEIKFKKVSNGGLLKKKISMKWNRKYVQEQ